MPKLYPEDQKKVDDFIRSNVNSVERPPFRMGVLLAVIFLMLVGLTLVSYWVALGHGVI